MPTATPTRDRLLDSACDLIHRASYSGVGVAEICLRADVRKGSFYHYFDSKASLVAAAVEKAWVADRVEWVDALSSSSSPLSGVASLFDLQVQRQRAFIASDGAVLGCLYANLALEVGRDAPPVVDALRAVFSDQTDLVAHALRASEGAGEVDALADVGAVARGLLAQLEGEVLLAKLHDDPSMLDGVWDRAARLVPVV